MITIMLRSVSHPSGMIWSFILLFSSSSTQKLFEFFESPSVNAAFKSIRKVPFLIGMSSRSWRMRIRSIRKWFNSRFFGRLTSGWCCWRFELMIWFHPRRLFDRRLERFERKFLRQIVNLETQFWQNGLQTLTTQIWAVSFNQAIRLLHDSTHSLNYTKHVSDILNTWSWISTRSRIRSRLHKSSFNDTL